MFAEVTHALKLGLENVDVISTERIRAIKENDFGSQWRSDETLQKHISQLKSSSDLLSDALTKLTLLSSKSPSATQLESLLNEVKEQIVHVVGSFLAISGCSLSKPLLKLVSQSTRGLLVHTLELVHLLSVNKFQESKSATGMVWKEVKNIQQLPMANKVAYRRGWMEDMASVKDTVTEFDAYLKEACDKATQQIDGIPDIDANDDADDEDDGEDSEDADYSPAEVTDVSMSVDVMKVALEVLKFGLQIMTGVADSYTEPAAPQKAATETPDGSTIATVFSKVAISQKFPAQSCPELTPSSQAESAHVTVSFDEIECRQWVSNLASLASSINGSVIDLGAELYPPVDLKATALGRTELQRFLRQCTDLLLVPQSRSIVPARLMESVDSIARTLGDADSGLFLSSAKVAGGPADPS